MAALLSPSTIFSLIFFLTLPVTLFSGLPLTFLFFSFSFGLLIYTLFQRPALKLFLFFWGLLFLVMFLVKFRSGIDFGLLNSINSQRGEHSDFQTSLYPKLLHNKTELIHSFISNVDRLISPAALFASGFWHHLSPYYPLGYLFPWDIYFIYRYISRRQYPYTIKTSAYFIIPLTALILLSGLTYIDQAVVFSFGLVYFLAFLTLQGYLISSRKVQVTFITLNALFIFYQIWMTGSFRI